MPSACPSATGLETAGRSRRLRMISEARFGEGEALSTSR